LEYCAPIFQGGPKINAVRRRSAVLASVAVLVVLAATGCGKTVIDDAKTEDALAAELESPTGKRIVAVECPSGVEVEAGASFECTVRLAGGGRETATLEVLNEDADVELTGLEPTAGRGEG
jgi:hypothetical protein